MLRTTEIDSTRMGDRTPHNALQFAVMLSQPALHLSLGFVIGISDRREALRKIVFTNGNRTTKIYELLAFIASKAFVCR